MRDWEAFMPEDEREVYGRGGYGNPQELGARPALIVIDCTVAFTGSRPQTVAEAQGEYGTACGAAAWEALPRIRKLLDLFRSEGLHVVHTRNNLADRAAIRGATKALRARDHDERGNSYPALVVPLPGEWVLEKSRASAFHSTPLAAYLAKQRIDSLVMCGTSTSGCVRASVVDAFSCGYTAFVVDECCFDRARTPHLANLWDMNAKYATVVSLERARELVGRRSAASSSIR